MRKIWKAWLACIGFAAVLAGCNSGKEMQPSQAKPGISQDKMSANTNHHAVSDDIDGKRESITADPQAARANTGTIYGNTSALEKRKVIYRQMWK